MSNPEQRMLQQNRPFATTVEAVMQKMCLMHPEDAYLLPHLLHWVKTQRPNYMYTTVLALAVLLQRLARAFSMRSGGATAISKRNPNRVLDPVPPPASMPQPPPAGLAGAHSVAVPPNVTENPTQPTRKNKKSKAFRSTKKLDLSPRVVETLKGFVADLAAAIPLILKHAEYEQRLNPQKPGIFVPQRAPTAVDIVDVALELLEGPVMSEAAVMGRPLEEAPSSTTNNNNNNNKKQPNAAMELFRTVLAKTARTAVATTPPTTTNTSSVQEGQSITPQVPEASAMDQLKFKTFCVKTLESSQTRTVHLVEAHYDFRLLWNISCSQHSVVFVPMTGSPDLQEELAWRMTVWRVWKHQERHPALCDRRQRLLAATSSLILLALFPFFHRHPRALNANKGKKSAEKSSAASTSSDATNVNNKRPLVDVDAGTIQKKKTSQDDGDEMDVPGFPYGVCDACSKQERTRHIIMHAVRQVTAYYKLMDIQPSRPPQTGYAKSSKTAIDSTKESSAGPDAAKSTAVAAVAEKEAAATKTTTPAGPGTTNITSPVEAATTAASSPPPVPLPTVQTEPRPAASKVPVPANSAPVTKAAPPSVKSTPPPLPELDLTRTEIEEALLQLVRDLAAFSTVPVLESDDWIEILKVAINMKNDADVNAADTLTPVMAESNLLYMIDRAFEAMARDDDDRMGTRVEAVSYVEEMTLASEASRATMDYLCQATTRKQKKSKLVAFVPETGVPTPRRLEEIKQQSSQMQHQQRPPPTYAMSQGKPFASNNQAVSATIMTEPMELNEWTIAILASLTAIAPSANLVQLLNGAVLAEKEQEGLSSWQNVVIPVLNKFIGRMRQSVGDNGQGPPPLEVGPDGVVRCTYHTQDTQLWAAIIQVYYRSLESILVHEKKAATAALILAESFHEALLACCYLCAARAVILTNKMQLPSPERHQIYVIMPLTGTCPYSYLKVTESFMKAMTANDSKNGNISPYEILPRLLQKEVKSSEIFVIESLVWARDHSNPQASAEGYVVRVISELKQAQQWPPACLKATLSGEIEDLDDMDYMNEETAPETAAKAHPEASFVSYIMRKLLKISYFRIKSICKSLNVPIEYPVVSQVWLAYRFLLRNHVELLYGRHIDQWILISIYSVTKMMKYEPVITFARIIDVYVATRGKDLGERTCQAICRHVKILDGAGGPDNTSYNAPQIGNILKLYNIVYVPIFKNYLLKSKSLKKNAKALKVAMKNAKEAASSSAAAALRTSDGKTPVTVKKGNVVVQVTVNGGAISMNSMSGTFPGDRDAAHSSFLQFGHASGAMMTPVANELVAQAANLN